MNFETIVFNGSNFLDIYGKLDSWGHNPEKVLNGYNILTNGEWRELQEFDHLIIGHGFFRVLSEQEVQDIQKRFIENLDKGILK